MVTCLQAIILYMKPRHKALLIFLKFLKYHTVLGASPLALLYVVIEEKTYVLMSV